MGRSKIKYDRPIYDTVIAVRITERLRDQLIRAADAERRNISDVLRFMLEAQIEGRAWKSSDGECSASE